MTSIFYGIDHQSSQIVVITFDLHGVLQPCMR